MNIEYNQETGAKDGTSNMNKTCGFTYTLEGVCKTAA